MTSWTALYERANAFVNATWCGWSLIRMDCHSFWRNMENLVKLSTFFMYKQQGVHWLGQSKSLFPVPSCKDWMKFDSYLMTTAWAFYQEIFKPSGLTIFGHCLGSVYIPLSLLLTMFIVLNPFFHHFSFSLMISYKTLGFYLAATVKMDSEVGGNKLFKWNMFLMLGWNLAKCFFRLTSETSDMWMG